MLLQNLWQRCNFCARFFFIIMLAFGLHLANCKWQSLYDVNCTTQTGSGSPAQLLCAVHFHLDGGSWRNAGTNYPKVHGRVSESRFFDIECIQKLLKRCWNQVLTPWERFDAASCPPCAWVARLDFQRRPCRKKLQLLAAVRLGLNFAICTFCDQFWCCLCWIFAPGLGNWGWALESP